MQVDIKGPIGSILYTGKGNYTVDKQPFRCTKLGMIAGGTGITPMWQVRAGVLSLELAHVTCSWQSPTQEAPYSAVQHYSTISDVY